MMTPVTRAIVFAAWAHDGAKRRGSTLPYIVHPMEVATIASTFTADEEVICAALLHDVIEDCAVTYEDIRSRFGKRVADLVLSETQTPDGDPSQSWRARKREALRKLQAGGRDEKLIALADKLSNMRAMRRDYARVGDALFERFHEKNKLVLAQYYRSCAALLKDEFGDTAAYKELAQLIEEVFAGAQ